MREYKFCENCNSRMDKELDKCSNCRCELISYKNHYILPIIVSAIAFGILFLICKSFFISYGNDMESIENIYFIISVIIIVFIAYSECNIYSRCNYILNTLLGIHMMIFCLGMFFASYNSNINQLPEMDYKKRKRTFLRPSLNLLVKRLMSVGIFFLLILIWSAFTIPVYDFTRFAFVIIIIIFIYFIPFFYNLFNHS